VDQVDLFEINEVFASVAIQSMGIGADVVNVNGGAIAMGYPIGASGARFALHLANELRRRGGGTGVAGLCGGQCDALVIRVPA
jgi:acetyl-CoA C-acetyltransferase